MSTPMIPCIPSKPEFLKIFRCENVGLNVGMTLDYKARNGQWTKVFPESLLFFFVLVCFQLPVMNF